MDDDRFAQQFEGLTPGERARVRDLVDQLVECDRSIARAEGKIAVLLAELAHIAHEDGLRQGASEGVEYARRAMAGEVAAATRVHPVSAKNRMEAAERLTSGFPVTHAALAEGRISKRHADVIVDAGAGLDPGGRASLDAHAVGFAATRTAGEVARIAKVQADELAPISLRERHERARRERRVVVTECADGMSELWMLLPSLEARAIYDRVTQMARTVKSDRRRARAAFSAGAALGAVSGDDTPAPGVPRGADPTAAAGETTDDAGTVFGAEESEAGVHVGGPASVDGGLGPDAPLASGPGVVVVTDVRSMDQLRADILADIFLTSSPTGHELHASGTGEALGRIDAVVQVTIPVSQIIDPDAGSSRVDEGGLIAPETARVLAGRASGWDRLFIRPETGQVVAVDRYRPSREQRRALVGRDVTCRFPGCLTPARGSDIDHTREYARGGPTEVSNLAHLCESHHMMKHHSGWGLRQLPDGVLEWTSPAGRVYADEPLGRVFFQEVAGAPERHGDREYDARRSKDRGTQQDQDCAETHAPEHTALYDRRRHHERAGHMRDDVEARRVDHTEEDRRDLAFAAALVRGEITDPAAEWWDQDDAPIEVR